MSQSLYIHVPFCRRKCAYCDFYSVPYEEGIASDYVAAILTEVERLNGPFSTIYVGGGTPSVLGQGPLLKLLKGLRKFLGRGAEFTLEANPESVDCEKLKLCFGEGVNRISIGVQSLRDRKLAKLGRPHSARQGRDAVHEAGQAGFKNVGIDLIYGVWGEGVGEWEEELKEALELPAQHISCYFLTYEKPTPLYDKVMGGKVAPLDDTIVARMYKLAMDRLNEKGFLHYEVSNFAKDGFESRHNMNYWENGSYIGLGASAVSYIRGVRTRNIASVEEYIRRVNAGESPVAFQEELAPLERARETAAVKIRTQEGIGLEWFQDRTGYSFLSLEGGSLSHLVSAGLVKHAERKKRIKLTRKGFLFCDTVSSAFL